jgi:outer membrane protein
MKRFIVLACATAALSLAAGNVYADSIEGKIGVTGKIGVLLPSDGDFNSVKDETDAGFIFGGGLIYGIDKHFAAEIDVTRTSFDSKLTNFGVTNIALGAQYRFALSQPQFVPYLGAGVDILLNDADRGYSVDNTVGVHAAAGIDYFLMKKVALTAEAKLLVAPDTDINGPGGRGNFNPTAFSSTFGVRYFFN